MNRETAYGLLTKYLTNKNLIKHCLACEAAMKAIYRHLHEKDFNKSKEETWGITGLLHDADYELAQNEGKLDRHGLLLFEKEPNAVPQKIAHAIKAHNFEHTKILPENDMDWAIACVDQLTGLIVAAALIHPGKKLELLTADFIRKRMHEKSFARGADRTAILLCEEKLGIPIHNFIAITLKSMQSIHEILEL